MTKRNMSIRGEILVEGYGELAFEVATDLTTDASVITGQIGAAPIRVELPVPKKRTKPIAPGQSLCTVLEAIASNFLSVALDAEEVPSEEPAVKAPKPTPEIDMDEEEDLRLEYERLMREGVDEDDVDEFEGEEEDPLDDDADPTDD
jgi:hypothetical protein